MIRVSDNAASNTLITRFGMEAINATMRLAGMTRSQLRRHFADVVPAWRVSENVVTPADVATLLFAIERGAREGIPTIASAQSCRAMIEIMLHNDDGSKIVRGLPHGTPCAHKTGEITGVRNDAAIVDPFGDTPYIIVALTKNLENQGAGDTGIARITHRIDTTLRGTG
jgi:beta-lactamase class A